ncbi:hypothetical protein HWV23_10390 [Natronomonas halophila]|nr:hypothetical protein [Natronomonas halophila]QLD86117.1 hypothetical protein HWV23_10390 [Natronomonas halophila]
MTTESEPRDANDQQVFRRVGILTILWVILLVIAGLALIFFGDSLFELVT